MTAAPAPAARRGAGRRPARAALVAALAALVVGPIGCGRPALLDVDRAETRIAATLAEVYDVEVRSVACPDEVRVADGGRFRCRARLSSATLAVDVRQTDGEGALQVDPTAAVLVSSRVADDIVRVLADRFERDEVEVTCPGDDVRIEEPDATFTCTAVDGDESKDVTVRVRGARGALTYTLGDGSG